MSGTYTGTYMIQPVVACTPVFLIPTVAVTTTTTYIIQSAPSSPPRSPSPMHVLVADQVDDVCVWLFLSIIRTYMLL